MKLKKENWTLVYLKAAESISTEEEEFSCAAISERGGSQEARNLYILVFNPEGDNFIEKVLFATKSPRQFRVLLLCMMAACWRDFI